MVSTLMQKAAALDPHFIAIGGDMNYDNGNFYNFKFC
jgi:hypothetical protein